MDPISIATVAGVTLVANSSVAWAAAMVPLGLGIQTFCDVSDWIWPPKVSEPPPQRQYTQAEMDEAGERYKAVRARMWAGKRNTYMQLRAEAYRREAATISNDVPVPSVSPSPAPIKKPRKRRPSLAAVLEATINRDKQ